MSRTPSIPITHHGQTITLTTGQAATLTTLRLATHPVTTAEIADTASHRATCADTVYNRLRKLQSLGLARCERIEGKLRWRATT